VTPDQELVQFLQQTPYLNPADKSFVYQRLSFLSPLERMRIRGSLASQNPSQILQMLNMLKAQAFQNQASQYQNYSNPQRPQNPNVQGQVQPQPPTKTTNSFHVPGQQASSADEKEGGLLNKIQNVFGKKDPSPVTQSIMTQPQILGGPAVQPVRNQQVSALYRLEDFSHPAQLSQLQARHISFDINTNGDQVIQKFLEYLSDMFDSISSNTMRRSYYMNFLESPLFSAYMSSAITALKRDELQPRSIALNLLNQVNGQFLNLKQFTHTAQISNHLRNLCGL
jgi:hypothetical protein